jgi:hypothetical protein
VIIAKNRFSSIGNLISLVYLRAMTITLKIKNKKKLPFFMELIDQLGYVELVKSKKLSVSDKEFVSDIKKSMRDITLHQSGKKKLKSAKQLLNEI